MTKLYLVKRAICQLIFGELMILLNLVKNPPDISARGQTKHKTQEFHILSIGKDKKRFCIMQTL